MNITASPTAQTNTSLLDTFTDTDAQSPVFHPRNVVVANLWKFCSPFLILLGTFGNAMSIAVLSRKSMREMTSLPYLLALSVTDIVVLNTGLLPQWMAYVFQLDIIQVPPVVCKLTLFLVCTSIHFSAWILVALSVDRFIFVCIPFKAKALCTRKRAMVTILLILLALSLLNSHFFLGFGSLYDPDTSKLNSSCVYLYDEYETFYVEILPWIYLSVYFIIPFCIIVTCNISIITKLVRLRRFNRATSSDTANKQRVNKSSPMTGLLLSLNTLFLVTSAPVSIYLISHPPAAEGRAQLTMWRTIVNQLMYLNNAVNFLFYCISGPRFRSELKALCGRRGTAGSPH